jgi:lipopolysaccharide transport system permease protein
MQIRTAQYNLRPLIYIRDLLRELVARDMKLRYKRSMLGIAWSLLNPLAQILVFNFIFGLVLSLGIPHYTTYLFIGVIAWSWFSTALLEATGAIIENGDLLKRPGFPAAILPVVMVTTHLIHFLFALPVLGLFLIFGDLRLTGAIAALPFVIGLQFLLTLSLAYLVATIHVTFRDTQYLLGIILMLGFYLTPIFYPPSVIPEPYQILYRLNPMVDILSAYRTILMQGEFPNPVPLLVIGVCAVGILGLGYTYFIRTSYRFVEEL